MAPFSARREGNDDDIPISKITYNNEVNVPDEKNYTYR